MKKKIHLLTFMLGSLLTFSSCDNAMKDNFPSEFSSVLHFRIQDDKNEIALKLLKTDEPSRHTFDIGKSGNDPSTTASGQINVLSQEELDTYNFDHSTNYKILPEKYYSFSTHDLSFGAEESMKTVEVTFQAMSIDDELDVETSQYVVPIRLSSTSCAVNEQLNLIVLKPAIVTPAITLDMPETSEVEMNVNNAEQTKTVPLTLYIDLNENKWAFSATFETAAAELQAAANAYKVLHPETNYTLLSAGNYSLPSQVDFAAGKLLVAAELTINREGLAVGDYLLPVILKECVGQPFDVNKKVAYIHLNLKDQLPAITLTEGMINTSRAEMGTGMPGWDVPHPKDYLLDGDASTYWQSEWTVYPTNGDERKPHHPKYGLYIDVALNSEIQLFAFDYQTYQKNTQVSNPVHIQIYFGNDANSLSENPNIDISSGLPKTNAAWYKSVNYKHSTKFKYVRIALIKNQEGRDLRQKLNSSVAVGELRVYGQ